MHTPGAWHSPTGLFSPHCVSSPSVYPCGHGHSQRRDLRESVLLTWCLDSKRLETEPAKLARGFPELAEDHSHRILLFKAVTVLQSSRFKRKRNETPTPDGGVEKWPCRNTCGTKDGITAILEKYNPTHVYSISDEAKQMPPKGRLWEDSGRLVKCEAWGPILPPPSLSSSHIIDITTSKCFSTEEFSNDSLLSFQRFNT